VSLSREERHGAGAQWLEAMIRTAHLRTLCVLAVFVTLAFIGLGARLYFIQVLGHARYHEIVGDNTRRHHLKQPRRGDILDANTNQLATSLPVKRVLADPSLLHPYQAQVARALAPLLNWKEEELVAALRLTRTNSAGELVTNRYVDLKRKLTQDQWSGVTQAMAGLTFELEQTRLTRPQQNFFHSLRRKGIYGEDDYQRVYPSGRLASHVLGFVQEIERVFTNSSTRASARQLTGIYGIEHWLDPQLKGTAGWRETEINRLQREVVVYRGRDVEAGAGLSTVLTIDMFIQNVLEEQLRQAQERYSPKSVCGMVMRPRTGEILAMASLPDFDPNQPNLASVEALRNRNIADMHEPGSTFKIVVISGALNEQVVTLNDMFFCENGRWMFKGRPLHDHDHGYGDLSVQSIITKSSNIGSAKIAVYRLGEERLYQYMTRFGFGQRTGITLDGEIRGWVSPPAKWDGLAVSRIPMGHAITTTHLQMVMAMAAIANEGRLMRPMVIKSLRRPDGSNHQTFEPQMIRQVVRPETARQMITALKTVPAKEGSAPKAAMEHYTVAGKTGTAQVPGGPAGYLPRKYVSSFIGFFPADDPEVCISVLLEEPDMKKGYYGGQTAAPYFRVIAEQVANYLRIKPDKDDVVGGTLATGTNGPMLNTAALDALNR